MRQDATCVCYAWYNDLALYYEGGRHTLRLGLRDRWKLDQYGTPTAYQRLHAREFRCDWVGDPRQRSFGGAQLTRITAPRRRRR